MLDDYRKILVTGGWHAPEGKSGRNKNNVVFADGHASAVLFWEVHDLNSSANHTGNFMARGFRPEKVVMPVLNMGSLGWTIWRGEGWQIDCFPAPPVQAYQASF